MSFGKKNLSLFVLMSFFILGTGTFLILKFKKNQEYEYVHPKKSEIIDAIYGMGKIKSVNNFDVKVGVTSRIEKIYADEGSFVKKNSDLIKFSDFNTFKSPMDGVVTHVNFDEFDTVPPQVVVMTLQDLNQKYIEVSLEQEGALRVKKDQVAFANLESLRGTKFQGSVKSIYPKDGEFIAHIDVQNLPSNILPGMTADVSIIIGKNPSALLIPVSSLTNGEVILKRDGKKQKVSVSIGAIDGAWAEVLVQSILATDEILMKTAVK